MAIANNIVALSALFAVALCAPQQSLQETPILRHTSDVGPDGTHNYVYETGNGIYADQQGYLKAQDTLAVQGQYQFVAPDGQAYHLTYTADENGYHPTGDHLPTPPPVPAAIQKSLDYLASLPPRETVSNQRF